MTEARKLTIELLRYRPHFADVETAEPRLRDMVEFYYRQNDFDRARAAKHTADYIAAIKKQFS